MSIKVISPVLLKIRGGDYNIDVNTSGIVTTATSAIKERFLPKVNRFSMFLRVVVSEGFNLSDLIEEGNLHTDIHQSSNK